jgi:hypothetical protein
MPVRAHSAVNNLQSTIQYGAASGGTNHADFWCNIWTISVGVWLHCYSVMLANLRSWDQTLSLFASAPIPYRGAPLAQQPPSAGASCRENDVIGGLSLELKRISMGSSDWQIPSLPLRRNCGQCFKGRGATILVYTRIAPLQAWRERNSSCAESR